MVALAALREVAVGPLALADLVFVVLQALQEALERLAARTKLLLSSLGLFAATKDRSGDSGADHSTDDGATNSGEEATTHTTSRSNSGLSARSGGLLGLRSSLLSGLGSRGRRSRFVRSSSSRTRGAS